MRIKKFICAAVAVFCVGVVGANAAVHPNAIGLRFGGGSLSGAELNYQRAMGGNRLEVGASWSFESEKIAGSSTSYNTNYLGLIAAYQWHLNLAGVPGLNWYVGPGAGVGFWSWSYDFLGSKYDDSGLYVDVGGQIGIEYDLNTAKVPLLLSLDVRPMFGLLNNSGFGWGAGLGVRYTF
jgi:hypothetical protein